MAEKDLAQDMNKKEDSKQLLEKIKKIENEIKIEKENDNLEIRYFEDCEIELGGNMIKVSIAEVKEKSSLPEKNADELENDDKEKEETDIAKSYNIYMNVKGQDIKIAEIDEEGKLILNEEALEKIDPQNILGLKELGDMEKPDLSLINELEGKTAGELEELGEYDLDFLEGADEQSLDELEENISEEEMPEEERIDKLVEIEAAKQGKSKDELRANMIELELDEIKVTENKTLRQLLGTECTRVFAVPGRDASEYSIKGLNEDGKLEDLENLKKVEGTNPTQKIAVMGKDGKQIETKSTIAMFELEGKGMREGIAIGQGQLDYKEISYYRRADDNTYISIPVAQKNGVDRDESTLETKELMDRNTTTHDELEDYLDSHEKLEEMKKQEMPDEINITIDGIQYEDVVQGKEIMVQKLLNDTEYDYTREEAIEIINNIVDKGMDFEKAREEIDMQKQQAREEDEEREKTPWDDAMRRRGY